MNQPTESAFVVVVNALAALFGYPPKLEGVLSRRLEG